MRATHAGHISAGGVEKEGAFVDADEDVNEAVDDAYRTRYGHYANTYVEPMIRPDARTTTIKLAPL